MVSVGEFLGQMAEARDRRREIVGALLAGAESEAPSASVAGLERVAAWLGRAVEGTRLRVSLSTEGPSSREVSLDVGDEVRELGRDLELLRGSGSLSSRLRRVLAGCGDEATLAAETRRVTELLRPGLSGLVLLTDWDGTMKTYGNNYSTCVQPAYSALVLCRLAASRTAFAGVLTAGPLRSPGVLDLTAVPDWVPGASLSYGGCWGREWLIHGHHYLQDSMISTEHRAALAQLASRLGELLGRSFPAFRFIGSGLQRKVDRLTLGVQNVSGDVSETERAALLTAVEALVVELDPERAVFNVERGPYDVELIVRGEREEAWDKGRGVEYLEELYPDLGLSGRGFVLVCGDTASDLPMLRHCLERNGAGTRAVFVDASPAVRATLAQLFHGREEDYALVSCPQVLHTAFAQLLEEPIKAS